MEIKQTAPVAAHVEEALLKSEGTHLGEMKMSRKRKKHHSRVTGLRNAVLRSRKGGRVLALWCTRVHMPVELLPVTACPVTLCTHCSRLGTP